MPDINLHEQISRWVDAHREEFLRDTARLVAVKSVREDPAPGAPFGPGPRQALEEAMALCGEYGFETAVYADCVGVASFGPQPAAVDLLCHLDVVGEGDLADWNSDPYQMTLGEDDCAYGRGTIDDKGPAVAALYALRCLRDLSLPLRSGARLILGTDEESGMDDLPRYYALCQAAPNTFSPDANFPVYNTEKGHYQPVFTAAFEKTEPC